MTNPEFKAAVKERHSTYKEAAVALGIPLEAVQGCARDAPVPDWVADKLMNAPRGTDEDEVSLRRQMGDLKTENARLLAQLADSQELKKKTPVSSLMESINRMEEVICRRQGWPPSKTAPS